MGSVIWKRNNVTVLGKGPETLLLAHGFGSEQSAWRFQAEAFQDRYRVVLFDHVGCGKSDFNAYSAHRYRSLHRYAEDMLELCDELGLADCTLVGHSLSGMVGVLASAMDPTRFRRLVFVKASPRYLNDPAQDYVGGFEQAQIDALYESMSACFVSWASGFGKAAVGNPERPELAQEFIRSLSGMRPDIARSIARIIFQSDHRQELARVRPPTLILQAGEDFAVPDSVAHFMARTIPQATLVPIPARGHLPHLSAPLAVTQAVDAFLTSPLLS
ncbi:alpha/beta fold hydrolase [Stigmatella erecta]|uniref:Sigma-B regulation protein RsbQ n=1 Tax=Stigmatella erecta TaxID=83460 RepID=A0A1I0KQ75_9BACT|nr:alpha/beta hydrolase [Stigmatella erecta]SEU27610.1 sigma-B regulation protein RsbQ [Stigmatella erecta]